MLENQHTAMAEELKAAQFKVTQLTAEKAELEEKYGAISDDGNKSQRSRNYTTEAN